MEVEAIRDKGQRLLELVREGNVDGARESLVAVTKILGLEQAAVADRAVQIPEQEQWAAWVGKQKLCSGRESRGADALWLACSLLQPDEGSLPGSKAAAASSSRGGVAACERLKMVRLLAEEFGALFPMERRGGKHRRTPLLEVLNRGALSVSQVLLSCGALPSAAETGSNTTPLVLVCLLDGVKADAVADVVGWLLKAKADASLCDREGRSAALGCVMTGNAAALQAVLNTSSEEQAKLLQLRATTPGNALTPLAAAFVYDSSEVQACVQRVATSCGLAELARQERLAAEMTEMLNTITDKLESACAQGADDEQPRVCSKAVLELLDIDPAIEKNPLLHAVQALYAKAPLIHRKAWRAPADVAPFDREVVTSLQGRAEDDRPPLVQQAEPYIARAAGSKSWYVTPECHRFNELCLRPLQAVYGNAIPTDEALKAIAELRTPIVELGCGTGYLARLLRSHGVDIIAYDIRPPEIDSSRNSTIRKDESNSHNQDSEQALHHDEDDGECIFDRALIEDIRCGGPEVLKDYADRALLLAWPYEGSDEVGWDARCLELYAGQTVIFIGDWEGRTRAKQKAGMTSSPAFQKRLVQDFVCISRASMGKWAMVADELSIWRRKTSSPGSTTPCPTTSLPSFCRNCQLDLWTDSSESVEDDKGTVFCTPACRDARSRKRKRVEGGDEDGARAVAARCAAAREKAAKSHEVCSGDPVPSAAPEPQSSDIAAAGSGEAAMSWLSSLGT
eukprot:TRINITY_DN43223_c0_g1_i1.p1 TRINITY_DN43223_c0_g1~~TRINITY_DN43223_c0_g1_i1.p1  ORF type:complete len:738 (+),score=147.80 TRINITY_DN43223_c0_g1_i1:115-2328(+)